jgi:hypothetical protein
MPEERSFALQEVDQARTDFAVLAGDLDFPLRGPLLA